MSSAKQAVRAILINAGCVAWCAGVAASQTQPTPDPARVRITVVGESTTASAGTVRAALARTFAAAPGQALADRRILSVRPRPGDPTRFDASIYDYRVEGSFELVLDSQGNELSRQARLTQFGPSEGEMADAQAIVSRTSPWAADIASGTHRVYSAMPGVTVGPEGQRLINVGILAPGRNSRRLLANEVVSVHLPTAKITQYAAGAPPTSSAALATCNPPPGAPCGAASASCEVYLVEWPSPNPVWKFKIRHPSCTNDVQPQGTGLELVDVSYGNRLILKRAEMPVLNVEYDAPPCGPYRDWLMEEDCFQATGVDVAPGIRVTTGGAAPYTFCEASPASDAGNFKGIAVHDDGTVLSLRTELQAGWYRYHMEWRFHLNGTIEPVFGFGAVSNGCTCNTHHHHGYWRFEWALDGSTSNPGTGITTLERRQAGTFDTWSPVASEGAFIRPPGSGSDDWFRVSNPQTGLTYVIKPGYNDGSATGDTYAKADLWALALDATQIDDPNLNTSINLAPWLNGESIGGVKRLVTWYRAGFDHTSSHEESCEMVGPQLFIGPVAHYTFDNTASLGSDESGNGHHGVVGAATLVSGSCGNALRFLPDNNVHEFTVPHHPALNILGAMTGIAWIRPRGQQSTDNNPSCPEGTIFAKQGHNWFQISKNNDGIEFQNEGSGTSIAIQPASIPLHTWTQVAFVREADGRTVRFFKNGEPVGGPHVLAFDALPTSADLMVGNYGFLNNPAGCEFHGDIAEIRIYNVALPDEVIQREYDAKCYPVPIGGAFGMTILAGLLATAGAFQAWRRQRV